MQRMAELPLTAESRVLILGDAELEKTTAAFLEDEFGCAVDVVDEHADVDFGGQFFDLVVVNSNLIRPIRFPPPPQVGYLMLRRYRPVDEAVASRWGKVIWSEDLWTLQQNDDRSPPNIENQSPPSEPAPEEDATPPPSSQEDPESASSGAEEADDRPPCQGCGYRVAPNKNYGIAMSAHKRQCGKYQALQEEEDAGTDDEGL